MNEIKTSNSPVAFNLKSVQGWIKTDEYIPSKFTTNNVVGDYYGKYYCIVERPYKEDDSNAFSINGFNFTNKIIRTVELCYWNNLAEKFQDCKNEWVDAKYWSPVPEVPNHTIIKISRSEMLEKIESGYFEIIYKRTRRDNDFDSLWDAIKEVATYLVSLSETIYLSSVINEYGFEDCIWCKQIMINEN